MDFKETLWSDKSFDINYQMEGHVQRSGLNEIMDYLHFFHLKFLSEGCSGICDITRSLMNYLEGIVLRQPFELFWSPCLCIMKCRECSRKCFTRGPRLGRVLANLFVNLFVELGRHPPPAAASLVQTCYDVKQELTVPNKHNIITNIAGNCFN